MYPFPSISPPLFFFLLLFSRLFSKRNQSSLPRDRGWTGPPLNLQLGTYLSGTLIKASYPNRSLSRSLPRTPALPVFLRDTRVRDATGNGAMNPGRRHRYQASTSYFFGKWYQTRTAQCSFYYFRSKLYVLLKRNIIGNEMKLRIYV